MKLCRKFPVSLQGYCNIHKRTTQGSPEISGRYQKALYVYSAFMHLEDKESREFAEHFKDLISKPIDAFYIWWDI
jgi:hypothetical protein